MSVELIYGDCLEVMPTLPAQSVQMVFADLPYATLIRKTTDCRWDTPINLVSYWNSVLHCAENATHAMTATQPFASLLCCSNLQSFRYDLVWDRKRTTGHLNANRCPLRSHEHVLIFNLKQTLYNPQTTQGLPYVRKKAGRNPEAFSKRQSKLQRSTSISDGKRFPKSIIKFEVEHTQNLHPTQKPIALLEWLIRTYTNPGDTVLDPVAGSATTAIAAMRTGRKAICIEKDPTYFAAMQKRVADERARLDALPT